MQFLSGGIAGFFQTIVTNPLEIVKIRMQLDPTASISRTIGELGFFGLYKGVASCMVRDVCFSSLYFPAYAGLKKAAADANGEVSVISTLTCGFLAGFPAAFFSTPADVIKTRLQEKGSTYTGIPNAAVTIVKNEGFNAIWKGAGARCLRSPPQFAVTLLVYEILNRFVNEKPTAAPTYMNAEKHLRHPDDNGGLKFTHNHLTTKVEDKFGLKLPKFELSPSVLL